MYHATWVHKHMKTFMHTYTFMQIHTFINALKHTCT